MKITKLLIAGLAISSFATASFAGSPEPTTDIAPTIDVAEDVPAGTSTGSAGIVLPLIALAAVAALIADDGT